MSTSTDNWISKRPELLPDFIIGGAMKCGTTTLHAILNQHPNIQIAHNELGFFDMDNILNHPDFNFFDRKTQTWTVQSLDKNPELSWNWYQAQFEKLRKEGAILGEDSTTYLTSSLAAERIFKQPKAIKMIFVLRHPTQRTISNYLHALKSGRAIYTLEDTLRFDPRSIMQRSKYREQLEDYYKLIPYERIKVLLFEDLITNPEACISEVCDFLGVDFNRVDTKAFNIHSNKTRLPKNISLQLNRNRIMRKYGDGRYATFLPVKPISIEKMPTAIKVFDKIHKRINPLRTDIQFEPNPATITYLDDYFKTEMMGIDELTGMDIYKKWF